MIPIALAPRRQKTTKTRNKTQNGDRTHCPNTNTPQKQPATLCACHAKRTMGAPDLENLWTAQQKEMPKIPEEYTSMELHRKAASKWNTGKTMSLSLLQLPINFDPKLPQPSCGTPHRTMAILFCTCSATAPENFHPFRDCGPLGLQTGSLISCKKPMRGQPTASHTPPPKCPARGPASGCLATERAEQQAPTQKRNSAAASVFCCLMVLTSGSHR